MPKSNKTSIKFNFVFNNQIRYRPGTVRGELVKKARDELIEACKTEGIEQVYEDVKDFSPTIKKMVEEDLIAYTNRALSFFFSIESPNTAPMRKKAPLFSQKTITFKDTDPNYEGTFRAANFREGTSRSINRSLNVVWQALQPSTIRRKRRRGAPNPLRFFMDTGDLSRVLEKRLGQAFVNILSFNIDVQKNQKTGQNEVLVRAVPSSVIKSSALAALQGPNAALQSTGNNRRMISFLGDLSGDSRKSLIAKLNNGRRGDSATRQERPLLQPILGFWLINRFPVVFSNAVRKTFQ